jgi:hypothetical protein
MSEVFYKTGKLGYSPGARAMACAEQLRSLRLRHVRNTGEESPLKIKSAKTRLNISITSVQALDPDQGLPLSVQVGPWQVAKAVSFP